MIINNNSWRNLIELESLRGDWIHSHNSLSIDNIFGQLDINEDQRVIWLLVGNPEDPDTVAFNAKRIDGRWMFSELKNV